jgi:hypothetical protein
MRSRVRMNADLEADFSMREALEAMACPLYMRLALPPWLSPRRGMNETARTMALIPFGDTPGAREPRTLAILAKTIYRELRSSGFETRDVIALAGELLAQVTTEVRARKPAK